MSKANAKATINRSGNLALSTGRVLREIVDQVYADIELTDSAAELLALLLTVDGTGTLLDADLLDGLEGTAFVKVDGSTDFNGASMAVTEGSGWAGAAAVASEITKKGKVITTHLFVDIAGLVVTTTESDIIGDNLAANSHAGQFQLSESGQIFDGHIICLEAPTTGVADIDFTVSSASTGAEDGDVDALADPVILVAATESWTINMRKELALYPDATSDYLYLSAGVAGTPGTYDAGQFLIVLKGYEA